EGYSENSGSNPSKALMAIAPHLPRSPDGAVTWDQPLPLPLADTDRPELRVDVAQHDGRDIELYLNCPRRYLYQLVLGLSAGCGRFRTAVYRVLHRMGGQGGGIGAAAMAAQSETAWKDIGPHDDPLEALFRGAAQRILDQARTRSRQGIAFGETLTLEIGGRA